MALSNLSGLCYNCDATPEIEDNSNFTTSIILKKISGPKIFIQLQNRPLIFNGKSIWEQKQIV